MTLYTEDKWDIFNREKRYFLGRLILEAIFWNNSCENENCYYEDANTTRELETPEIGKLSKELREALWGHLLLCSCYKEIQGEGALIESAAAALVYILKELVKEELELAADFLEEDEEWSIEFYTPYRLLVESICRALAPRKKEDGLHELLDIEIMLKILKELDISSLPCSKTQPDDVSSRTSQASGETPDDVSSEISSKELLELAQVIAEEDIREDDNLMMIEDCFFEFEVNYQEFLETSAEYKKQQKKYFTFTSSTPKEMVELDDWAADWMEKFDILEMLFTAFDSDYAFGANISQEAKLLLKIYSEYYDQKDILKVLQENHGFCYWDLLFQCVEKRDLSDFKKVKRKPNKEGLRLLDFLNQFSDHRRKLLDKLVITNVFRLSKSPQTE